MPIIQTPKTQGCGVVAKKLNVAFNQNLVKMPFVLVAYNMMDAGGIARALSHLPLCDRLKAPYVYSGKCWVATNAKEE